MKKTKDGNRTDQHMYNEIKKEYEANKNLTFETINSVFKLSSRSNEDLNVLTKFIVAMTLPGEKDIRNPQLKTEEENMADFTKHKESCDLMSMLSEAIDSELYSR